MNRWDRRTLLTNSNYCLNHATVVKLYNPYIHFSRRIATFSAQRDFLIIAPCKYSTYLLIRIKLTDHVVGKCLLGGLECYKHNTTEMKAYNIKK